MKNKESKSNSKCLFRKVGLFAIAALFSISAFAQGSITITGKVIDEFGDGLPGVSVRIDGTTSGTLGIKNK